MTFQVYDHNKKPRIILHDSDSSNHQIGIQEDDILSLSMAYFECVRLEPGDYMDFLGSRYWILEAYTPKQASTVEWQYEIKFYGTQSIIKQALMLSSENIPLEAYTAPAREQLAMVVKNINRWMDVTDWKVGECIATENLVIDYSGGTYVNEALGKIAEAAGVEWWMDGMTINMTRCERDAPIDLGYNKGLLTIERDNADNVKFFTRLFPVGSTKNIDPEKYGHSHLQLPGGEKYVEKNTDEFGVIEHYEKEAFEAIFPRRTGHVSVVSSEPAKDDDGTEFTIYYFTDDSLNFDPNDYEIGGIVKHIAFQDGELAGRDFEVNYDSEKKRFEIITTFPYDDGTQVPGGLLVPKEGNAYILYNIRMPDEYYPTAETEYNEAVKAFLENHSNMTDRSVYKCSTDYIDLDKRGIILAIGQRVRLVSDFYFPKTGYRDSRITRITRNVQRPNQADIEISDVLSKGTITKMADNIEQVKNYTQTAVAGIPDLIRSWESTPASDYNLYSSKKVDREIGKKSLSRLYDDNTAGHMTFENGITVKSDLTARQLKSVMSEALTEPGDNTPEIMSLSMTEEGNGNPEMLSTSLSEVALDGGFGGSTLGELDNVDSSFDTLKPGKYGIEVKSDGIIRPVPATSLGVGSRLTLTAKSDLSMIALTGDSIILNYEFTSFDTSDGSPTGVGTAYYNVNGVRVATMPVEQGIVAWDCTKYLISGDNTITVSVTDAYSVNRMLTFTVQVVTLSISSTFDEFQPYTGDIQFRYTPVGAITKNVIFKLDNKAIATVPTTANNRQMTQTIPAQSHGAHILEVYIEATVGERTVKSNVLRYAVVCYVSGNNTAIIASSFNVSSAGQYNTLSVPFFVYNPAASTASVSLKVNGTVVSERVVDRTRQVWNYRADKAGSLTLNISIGSIYKSFTLNITASEIDVSAETEHLQLFLTAAGRSNNEAHPEQWSNNGISASLTGFNFVTNGWIADEKGIVSLKVSGDARVAIPMKVFGDDFRATGKTIEFELSTTDVVDYNAIVASCMNGGRGIEITAQSALLRSEQSAIDTRFKEEERVRVAFVIEDRTGSRLIYTYIDGIASGVIQYPTDDNFMQAKPADIVIGSNDCTVCIHNIRVYQAALNQFQMLDNCIADMDDMQKKIAMYTRNQIFDAYGDVSYPKVLEQIPGLTIIGDLPTFKGDKKTVILIYEDKQNPARSWRAENVQIDVQGTSSQYYPRKNFKVKCKNGFIMTATGEVVKKFAIREGEIPVNTFCFKADFAESSGTHNTGMAKVIDRVLRAMNYLVPPQKLDARVRTTVDGYPFTIFHRATESSPLEFVGKYNFNNDKSTQETFGFIGAMECWEIKNNTSDRVLFLKSDYTSKDAEGKPDWLNDFEARYPDDDDLNAEYEAGKIPVNLKRLTDWLVSTKGNPTKFKAEASQYFDLDFILSYYSITELFAMVDQRAKNMFLTTYDGVHWVTIFYDNDTVCGINNEGAVAFGYDVEYHDTEGSGQVWNGEQSVLWNNVEYAYLPEITAMYQLMRSSGAISYDMCIGVLNGEQSDKWCEAIYNADGKFKYIDPLLNEGNGSYLYALQGSRSQHRKWWLYNRFRYIDSKYVAGDFKNDYVTMRLYTPNVWQGVKPNADFTITPAGDVYVAVKYGSYMISRRGHKGEPIVIKAPEIAFNDTETIVYGAAYIGSLGDLSAMYPGTVDISKATKLTELIVGSGAVGYQNSNLTVLAIGNNTLFRRLNVMNCNKLTQPIDVSGCENIEEIYAQGTSVTSVKLPTAGRLSQLYLPDTITSLTIRNQTLTQDGFELADISNLSTVYIENTNGIDSATLINRCLASSAPTLERIRLIGVDWRLNSLDTLVKLAKLKGLDINGMNTDKAVVTGKCHVLIATSVKLVEVQAAFPELTITYTQLKPETVTTFVFGSSQNNVITNAVFECNFDFDKVSETTYKITAQDNETIAFTFKCDNHESYGDTYLVAGTRTQSYRITYIPLRTIRVKVYNQSVYLQGATVTFNGKKYTSDADGYITYRGGEAIKGEVSAFGYAGNTFSFGAITNDTTNTVEVYAAVEVKFVVKSSVSPYALLQGATIQCGDEQDTTNLYGECILLLGRGTYNYTVTHSDYLIKTGSITVGTSASTVNISLEPAKVDVKFIVKDKSNALLEGVTVQCAGKSVITDNKGECTITVDSKQTYEFSAVKYGYFDYTGNYTVTVYNITTNISMIFNAEIFKPEENGNIQMLLNGGTATINITSTSRNYDIVWGDGNIDSATGTGTKTYTHNYGNADNYQVEIRNCENITSCNGTSSCLIAYWSIGNSKVTNLSFRYFSRLCYVGQVFKNDTIRTDFYECFYGCKVLPNLPLGLFDDCINAKSFQGCFNGCSVLMSIPSNLFAKCSKVKSFGSTFSDCANLMDIPELLFDKNSEVTTFSYCFNGCKSIKTIPANLFGKCINTITFSNCFLSCTSLVDIPEGLFSKCTTVTDFSNCFRECIGLITIPPGLFLNCLKVSTFSGCFVNCKSIKTVPVGLFDNCPNVTSFWGLFWSCNKLEHIPEGLFDNCPNVESFSYCFNNCSKLDNIPAKLFKNCPNVSTFEWCFISCSSASHLPTLWVQYYGKDIIKKECYKGCTNADNWSDVPVSWGGTATEYVPPVQVSGVMMADYRALEMRIRNIEVQQNIDKN